MGTKDLKVVGGVVERDYNGMSFKFREDGYFNMTHAAKHFDKRLDKFWTAHDTIAYKQALMEAMPTSPSEGVLGLVDVVPGNRYVAGRGTWAHPKLAVFFARWLDAKFAVFCDMVIDDLMHGHATITVVNPEKAVAHTLPQTYLESLQHLIVAVQAQEKLQLEVDSQKVMMAVQAPKVAFHDAVAVADNCHDVGEAAKILGWSRNNLFRHLREIKLLQSSESQWNVPYQSSLDSGWFKVIETEFTNRDTYEVHITSKTVVTGKGMIYLSKKLANVKSRKIKGK